MVCSYHPDQSTNLLTLAQSCLRPVNAEGKANGSNQPVAHPAAFCLHIESGSGSSISPVEDKYRNLTIQSPHRINLWGQRPATGTGQEVLWVCVYIAWLPTNGSIAHRLNRPKNIFFCLMSPVGAERLISSTASDFGSFLLFNIHIECVFRRKGLTQSLTDR